MFFSKFGGIFICLTLPTVVGTLLGKFASEFLLSVGMGRQLSQVHQCPRKALMMR